MFEQYGEYWSEEASVEEKVPSRKSSEEKEASLVTCPSANSHDLALFHDGKWLKSHMKVPLRLAFKELLAKRPYDPVSYLAFWLLHYKSCLERNELQLKKDEELCRLRCLLKQHQVKEEKTEGGLESIVEERGEAEESTIDWNFQNYEVLNT